MPDVTLVTDVLVSWYEKHHRKLPWRQTRDPYLIWVSEIILQQTTVRQGRPYYDRFIERFPDVQSLAGASEQEVLKAWEGLGYYTRARNLHRSASDIVQNYGGDFPDNYKDIISLKGVGPYTAAAVASFAFDLSYPVVDGNVIRLISRLWGIRENVSLSATQKKITGIAEKMIHRAEPAVFNQAIMEFGAVQCVPRNPDCETCPLQSECLARKKNLVASLPVKKKKPPVKKRYFIYHVYIDGENNTLIEKRQGNDVWRGLYQFPMVETSREDFTSVLNGTGEPEKHIVDMYMSPVYSQRLTHQLIHAVFIRFHCKEVDRFATQPRHLKVNKSEITDYPFPKIIDLHLHDKSITLF